ncbi:type IV pilus modification PilV family protein [Microbacterium jejuense]|uniref:type IV pilus modification PilV family protein n=1 Tax=Microbacterium jejuense TaxID=1263637 RepID=UPI0031EAD1D4
MRGRSVDAAGFSLVEVIIAMVIMGVIALALIPILFQGIRLSLEQSSVATATRQLYAIVEEARESPTCGALTSATASQVFRDGANRDFTTSGATSGCVSCPAATGTTVSLELAAVQGTRTLATLSALIFVPAAKAVAPCA